MPKVDFAQYEGREQAYIKHCLLEEYLPEWGFKTASQWDSLVYVDGFAGPWGVRSPDLADSSFGIAVSALDRVAKGMQDLRGRQINVRCVLVEQDDEPLEKLRDFALKSSRPGFQVDALGGEFTSHIAAISQIVQSSGANPFKFVFLDPKGWSDIPMQPMLPLIKGRSCEVVINLMTRHIIRFIDEEDRAKSIVDLFGRQEVLPILRETPPEERHDALVREYCKSLHTLAGYKYVSSAAIFDPKKDEIRYFLIYGTNHHRGIEVFKAAESKAARLQDNLRYEAAVHKSGGQDDMLGQLFGEALPKSRYAYRQWEHYCRKARRKIITRLAEGPPTGVLFADLFCDAMAFPLVTPQDLHGWLDGLKGHLEIHLAGQRRKKASPDREDWIRARKPADLIRLLNGLAGA